MAEDLQDKRERGVSFFGGVLGQGLAEDMRESFESEDFGKETATWAADFAFGTVWTREGLERRMRSCVVIGMLMALRQSEELKIHTHIALQNGLTRKELEEALYLSVPYAGFPAANTAKIAMLEAFKEIENGIGPIF